MRPVPWARRIVRRVWLLIVTAVPLTAGALPGIDPRVFEALETDATARVLVTVSIEDEGNNDFTNPVKIIEAALGEKGPESRRIGGLHVVLTEIDQDGLEMLQSEARIASIFLDKPERLTLDASSAMMNVTPVHDQGFTGTGQVVAVLDTGVDAEHGFLAGKVVAEGCFSSPPASGTGAVRRQSLCPNGLEIDTRAGAGLPCDEPADQCAHGTHVAGIAAGVHMDTATFNGSGIAKGSDLVAIQVFTRFDDVEQCEKSGSAPCLKSYPSDQLEALEHVRFLASRLSIAAVNISIGGGRHEHDCNDNDPRATVIEDLRAMGIATVISSGNDGYYNAVNAPGCISSALTVGAAHRNSKDLNTDISNTSDLVDFVAPGTNVMSSVPGGFGPMTGTSMAAPHIAGSIALLRSQYPEASVAQMELALKMTSDQTVDPRTGMTLNFPHVADAANMLQIATLTDQDMQAPRTDSFATLVGATRIIIIPSARAGSSTATYELVKEALDDSTHFMVKTSGTIVAELAQGFDETSLNQLEETLTTAGFRPRVYRDTLEALH